MDITVRRGDTLWYYASMFNVPLRLIVDSNPQVNPDALSIGQTIRIPGYSSIPYQIQSGDTFWKLATDRNISLDSLYLLNSSLNANNLPVGQRINIPSRVTTRVVNGKQAYDSAALGRDLRELFAIYPFIRTAAIGKSVLGKELTELQIGRGPQIIHWNGSFHAQEWLTTPIIMTFLNDYLLSLTNRGAIRGLQMNPFYDRVTLSIVPMVNPDGVDLVINGPPSGQVGEDVLRLNNGSRDFSGWRANIRGVDLNNQYPAKWEEEAERKPDQPGPSDFPGYQPLTEPESVAMAELAGNRRFSKMLAFHTQGRIIFWGFEGLEPPESETIVNEFARVSGYRPIRYVDSFAGYKDWFIQVFRRPGFTVELGQGTNPLPLEQFDQIYQEAIGIFLASMYM